MAYKVLLTFAKQSDDFIKGEIEKKEKKIAEADKRGAEADKRGAEAERRIELWKKLLGNLKSIKENK